ncbi:unnamed protein product [Acanthoscelides obtectus]|uniref:Uncharacterized protein n=1 Tax=Acanthoscelides obtectus TaxID=200917 RepID=A0A9P0KVA5_ACAOB|nr:unnamed protein product [Acanthoscelides obtectus]CAK1630410.1 hypothetical protein AOBTE_LOCUS6308 [Acanthoscelides obtectus]
MFQNKNRKIVGERMIEVLEQRMIVFERNMSFKIEGFNFGAD